MKIKIPLGVLKELDLVSSMQGSVPCHPYQQPALGARGQETLQRRLLGCQYRHASATAHLVPVFQRIHYLKQAQYKNLLTLAMKIDANMLHPGR